MIYVRATSWVLTNMWEVTESEVLVDKCCLSISFLRLCWI